MQGVNAFRNWIQDSSNGIPNADHYMYFTGYGLQTSLTSINWFTQVMIDLIEDNLG